ncbi:MAG: dTMP kinase [Candidatus Margulisbacteria bacterium]|nr:dTMP kinase [Candidatus Margulisiibacteriota bacterium]
MKKNTYPGKLIVAEGLDGSGKTTQFGLTRNWLEIEGYGVSLLKRKNSPLVSNNIRQAKEEKTLIPITYSLIHAADFSDLMYNQVIPALKSGLVVLFNKYVYTSIAKDYLRGQNKDWINKLYEFAIEPDLTFYFKIDHEEALGRMTQNQKENDYYDSGMDIGLSPNNMTSIKKYQALLYEQYELMSKTYKFVTVDSLKPIESQQKIIRDHIKELLLN